MGYIGLTIVFRSCGTFSHIWDIIGIVAIRPYLPDVLCLCEVTKNDGKANEAILERYMIVLND